jgi:hypothetical protein
MGIITSKLAADEYINRKAPISLLIRELNKDIERFQVSDWATFSLDMASKVHGWKNVNPCARGQLLLLLLTQASQTAPVATKKISRQVNALDRLKIADINWLDDSGDGVEASRTKAAKILADMTDPAEYAKEIRKYLLSLGSVRRFSPVAIVTYPSQRIKLPAKLNHAYIFVTDTTNPTPRMEKLTPGKDGYFYPNKESLLTPGVVLFGSR